MSTTYVHLLLASERIESLAECAKHFFDSAGISGYEERDSSNYIEETYYKARTDEFICKLAYTDEAGSDDLPYWASFQFLQPCSDDSAIRSVETLAKQCLMPAGFRVARIADFGEKHSKRIDL